MATEIVEFSGPDYTGKSTQADIMAMETWWYRVRNFKSLAGYGSGEPQGLSMQDHFDWWFHRSSVSDMAEFLASAYADRDNQAVQSDVDVGVAERGRSMITAQLAANFATRQEGDVADFVDQAADAIQDALPALDPSVLRTEILLLPDRTWLDSQKRHLPYARTRETTSDPFRPEQKDFYVRYLRNLQDALAVVATRDGVNVLNVDMPAVDIANRVRALSQVFNGRLPQLLTQDPVIIGLAGLSESGKSKVGDVLARDHRFTRLKLGYFNESERRLDERFANPKKIAMSVLHFVATNRHLDRVSFESLYGEEVNAELKLLLGDRWMSIYITLEEKTRLQRLFDQYPDVEPDELVAQQAAKDILKKDAGVQMYQRVADIRADNSGTPEETAEAIMRQLV